MSKLFNPSMMEYDKKLTDWKQVVNHGVNMLVENGYATAQLENAILESTEKYGAYYVLEKGIALLHAAPGDYILKNGTSTLILDKEVVFNNQSDKSARIIITLSAKDSTTHIGILQEFSHYFMNDDFKKEALKVKSLEEFNNLLEKYKGE
ncbi:PTS sugar transporter subunit IIA [Mycoplasmopsis alligatoris]|uniref:Ascorbate-specific PTS system EIIA component n=1 Tax=Mycoplasmopsis alligatoris A21JP2 TaxID=747682 RepID=D4XWX8_9BACT|nr:PTS sugar transporter subunit IIA [Mycoplasmopsis alligatoris]EFF41114.1 phosphoenolpyruvate-dependent sugar phosphotransferase system, EIIA 2 [Mycoplasmopsis alligatoris A21JP2]